MGSLSLLLSVVAGKISVLLNCLVVLCIVVWSNFLKVNREMFTMHSRKICTPENQYGSLILEIGKFFLNFCDFSSIFYFKAGKLLLNCLIK